MKVWIYYTDMDNSCYDPECCGGPCPMPSIKVFSTIDKAKEQGIKPDDLIEVTIDDNYFVSLF